MLCFDGGGCRSNFALNSGPELADHARDPAISLVDHGPCDAHALAREVAAADGQSRPQPDTRPSVTVSADAALPNDLPQPLTLTGRRPESHRPGTKSRATGAWTAYEPYAKRVCPAIALEVFRIAMAAVAVRGTQAPQELEPFASSLTTRRERCRRRPERRPGVAPTRPESTFTGSSQPSVVAGARSGVLVTRMLQQRSYKVLGVVSSVSFGHDECAGPGARQATQTQHGAAEALGAGVPGGRAHHDWVG